MYPTMCLLLFYYLFAESIKRYGLLIYDSAAESNLEIIEKLQRRIMTAIFFETKLNPVTDILLDNGVLTVFELYLSELLYEYLGQLRHEAMSA